MLAWTYMRLRILGWNIGGGKIRGKHDTLYINDGRRYVGRFMRSLHVDIALIQETHSSRTHDELEEIAKFAGLKYWKDHAYGESHVETGKKLGLGVLSRFPIQSSRFSFFTPPRSSIVFRGQKRETIKPKGIQTVRIQLEKRLTLTLQNLHLIPFARFGLHPLKEETKLYRESVEHRILKRKTPFFLEGDFNFNQRKVEALLPCLFQDHRTTEIPLTSHTTPKKKYYDHVIYRGMTIHSLRILQNVFTDHFPLLIEIEIPDTTS